MKILFKNTTKYDKENTDNFTNFHKNKYGKKEITHWVIVSLCIIYIVTFNIMFKNWFFLFVLVLVAFLIYLINEKVIKNREEKNNKQKNKQFTFFFYEKYIKIKYKRQFERMNYFELKKIFETDKNFFLYVDEKNSLILDKEGFSIGTSKEFSEFIRRKCPFKYSNK